MGSKKPSTSKMMEFATLRDKTPWFRIIRSRAQELASDTDHSFSYRDRDALTEGFTRTQIIHIYETAYSELAESFHGLVDRNEELDQDLAAALDNEKLSHGNLLVANNRVDKLTRQITGLLNLMELSPYE